MGGAVPAGRPGVPSATVITPPGGGQVRAELGCPSPGPSRPSPGPSRPSTPPTLTSDPATCPIIPGCETAIHISKGRTGLGLSIVGGCDTLLVRNLPPPPPTEGAGRRGLMMSPSPWGGGLFYKASSQQTISSLGM